MTPPPSHLLRPRRRAFQWSTTLLLLLIPFLRVGGESLLRLDVATLSLHFFGRTFGLEDLFLFLLLGLSLIFLFLLLTLALGRAWCGWACPQTTLVDLVEGFARLIGFKVSAGSMEGAAWKKVLLHLFYLLVSLLFACNLLWYFVSPYEFFPALAAGSLGSGAWTTIATVGGAVYLDLALVRRLLCREFCPYGRFQTTLVDPGTLSLRFHPDEAHRCIDCGACVRSCPTAIDIRRGYQVECINCGRCLDACREVMARRKQAGIIRYTFGLRGRGARALLNPRMLLVGAVFLVLSTLLVVTLAGRPLATLKLARSATAESRVLEGRQVSFFTSMVTNRTENSRTFSLAASTEEGLPLEIKGPVREILLAGGEKRRLDFALVTPPPPGDGPLTVFFTLVDRGEVLARERAYIRPLRNWKHEKDR